MVALRVNRIRVGTLRGFQAVLAGVLLTALAGVGFCLLRLWSGSLLAPILVHATTNVGSLLTASRVQRTRRVRRRPHEVTAAEPGHA
jgi:membrane protease YdiL (CAAX protease family)